MITRVIFIALLLLTCGTAFTESFRCGNWIASEDLSVAELLQKCGEPSSKEREVVDVRGPSDAGTGTIKRGESIIERWTYDRGSQLQAMVVTIVDGEIESIERAE